MNIRKFFTCLVSFFLGLAFFWLIIMKIISRVLALFGISGPCPSSLSWMVNNRLRNRTIPQILDRVGVQEGEQVLELGPGPGAFTVEAARRIGSRGRLFAVDIQPEMIAQAKRRVYTAGLDNVEFHVASAYELPIPDAWLDRAFLVTVLMEIPDPDRALAELRRVLKPGGVLSITEEFMDPDYPFEAETIRRVERAGFAASEQAGNAWIYTVNFKKASLLSPEVLEVLACPNCHGSLELDEKASILHRPACQVDYPIRQGIPHFIEPKALTGLNRRFAQMYDWFSWIYRPFSKLAFAFIGMTEEQGRREIIDRLEPGGGRALEVSIGPGVNLPYLVNRPEIGEVYGLDISLGQLRSCDRFARGKGWPVKLFLGNAEQLPFKDNSFDAVFHIGGINFFNDKEKAIQEMIRVARPGSRILISDESEKGARGYEQFIPGFKRSFGGQRAIITPPLDLVPPEMQELRLFDVWKGWLYAIEFRKPEGS